MVGEFVVGVGVVVITVHILLFVFIFGHELAVFELQVSLLEQLCLLHFVFFFLEFLEAILERDELVCGVGAFAEYEYDGCSPV